MKKQFLLIAAVAATLFASCEKDKGKLPNIAFKTGGNYVSADMIVTKDTTITVGITASKAEDKDVLTKFDESQSLDGAAATSIMNESLSGSNANNYAKDIAIHVRNQAGTEKYTFTVINKDGLKNNVSLTLTVN